MIAISGRAVEAAGDVDDLLLDKTGTITLGNRQATAFLPADRVAMAQLCRPPSSPLADETPRAAHRRAGERNSTVCAGAACTRSAATSSVHGAGAYEREPERSTDAKGARVETWVQRKGSVPRRRPPKCRGDCPRGTPLVVAEGSSVLGVIRLKDVVKGGIKGVSPAPPDGDQDGDDHRRQSTPAIAAEAGVDDFLAQATRRRSSLIRGSSRRQARRHDR